MDVRLARPTDAALVLSLAVDAHSHIVKGFGLLEHNDTIRTLARASFPLATRGRTWIARDRSTVALLEAQPRQYVIGWDVTRLAARGNDLDTAVECVVSAAVCHLQNHGVPRLFCRSAEDSAATLRSLGFYALAREYILLSPQTHDHVSASPPPDSRYRMPQDSWPLHQLESGVTPPMVRQLEGLTSLDWSRPVRRMSEIVVERDGRVVGWISWGTRLGPQYRGLALLVHPDDQDLAPVLIRHALQQVPDGSRCVVRVRDYHAHIVRALTDLGFTIECEELLLVKHAGVEVVPATKPRMAVQTVPSISGFNVRFRPTGSGES